MNNHYLIKWAFRTLLGVLFLVVTGVAANVVDRVEKNEAYRMRHSEEFGEMRSDVKYIRQQVDWLVDNPKE